MSEQKPREWGSGSSTTSVYRAEVRALGLARVIEGVGGPKGLLITPETWTTIPTALVPASWGVPTGLGLWPEAERHGFLSYEAATAMAAWFQALVGFAAVETRLVVVEFKCSYSTRELGVTTPRSLAEEERQVLKACREAKAE